VTDLDELAETDRSPASDDAGGDRDHPVTDGPAKSTPLWNASRPSKGSARAPK